MAAYDFKASRLFVEHDLLAGAGFSLERAQANYLLSVMRLRAGDDALVFNGRDGEWRAQVATSARKAGSLTPVELIRPQPEPGNLQLLFAPLKHARLDYMVQKAVEMGVGRLVPVLTRRTVASRVNADRMRANAIEAAEQCGILVLPDILPQAGLAAAVGALEPGRLLVFCDEETSVASPLAALAGAATRDGLAVLVGPEGGFAPEERALIEAHGNVRRISLGPRILRADTAAVAALTVVQAALGDWR